MPTRSVLSSWGPGRPPGLRVIIDTQLAEVYNPSLLHLTERPSCMQVWKRWWWQGKWKSRALEVLGALEGLTLEFAHRGWPRYPEDKVEGRSRFAKAMDYWPSKVAGNVLFITHGDVSRTAVNGGPRWRQPRAASSCGGGRGWQRARAAGGCVARREWLTRRALAAAGTKRRRC